MQRVHREALWEVRRDAVAVRSEYRRLLDGERRRQVRVREELARYASAHTAYRGEHRAVLERARRAAREGLEAHRKALQENAWLLKLVALYERVQQMRAQRARARAERAAEAAPVAAQPAVAQT
jgi:ABC-type histidine transport system ATPase subunit